MLERADQGVGDGLIIGTRNTVVGVAAAEIAHCRCDNLQPIEIADCSAEQAHQLLALLSEVTLEEPAESGIEREQLAIEHLRHGLRGGRQSSKALLHQPSLIRSHASTSVR